MNKVGEIINGKYVSSPSLPRHQARLREMLTARQAPGLRGLDRSFLEGKHNQHGLEDMPPFLQAMTISRAKAAGITISGKQYKSGLANHLGPADPRAWVSSLGEAERVVKERNLHCVGAITNTPEAAPPVVAPRLSESLVREAVADVLIRHPMRDPREVREQVIEKHGAPQAPKRKRATALDVAKVMAAAPAGMTG